MDKSSLNQFKKFIKKNRALSVLFYPLIALHGVWLKHSQISFSEFYGSVFEKVEGGSLLIRIDSFNGVFEMSFKSHIMKRLLQFKEYESWLALMTRRVLDPSKDVIDVGANVGLFTVLCADLINKDRIVLAIEPVDSVLGYLKANIRRNKKENKAKVYEGVASDKAGHYEMNVIPGMEEYSSLGELVHPEIGDNISMKKQVHGVTIDQLVEGYSLSPGFIKIDAEGAEHLVFRGAFETLKKNQPVILSELSDNLLNAQGGSSADIFHYLAALGYSLFNADSLAPIDSGMFEGNFLALPAHKRDLIDELHNDLKNHDS
jgi:FkbM family methyltransferase